MSFRCTLHPVDQRVVRAMAAEIKGERADWDTFLRLWRKKQLLNRVNQSFKSGLRDLLKSNLSFEPGLHLLGRPFLIFSDEPEEISQKIAEFYATNNEGEIRALLMGELRKFSEPAYYDRYNWKGQAANKSSLGLKPTLQLLRNLYKSRKYKELAGECGFILAQLIEVAYPYWYVDNYGLSFLQSLAMNGWDWEPAGLAALFNEIPEIGGFLPPRLDRNLAAGIYLDPRETKDLLLIARREQGAWIAKLGEKQVEQKSAQNAIQKTIEALYYSVQYGFGILEASDIFEEDQVVYP